MAQKTEYDIPSSYHHTSKKAGSSRCHHWLPEKRTCHESSVHISVIQYYIFLLPLIVLQWRGIAHQAPFPVHSHSAVLVCRCVWVVCTYVCTYMHACVYRHACVLAQRSEENVGGPTTLTLSLFHWEKDSHWTWSYIGNQQSQEFCFYSTQS